MCEHAQNMQISRALCSFAVFVIGLLYVILIWPDYYNFNFAFFTHSLFLYSFALFDNGTLSWR